MIELIKKISLAILTTIIINTNIYAQNDIIYHPDGKLGSISFHANLQYKSVTKAPPYDFVDVEQLAIKLGWVSASQITLTSQAIVIKEDSITYQFGGGVKYYLKNPLNPNRNRNQDGIIGYPIISIEVFFSKTSGNNGESKFYGIATVIFPLAKIITFSGGYQYFDKPNEFDMRDKFLSIRYYFSRPKPTQMYLNPDGPIGSIVMELMGGASSKGEYGDIFFIFPLNSTVTLFSEMTYEKANFQNKKSYGAGIGFSYYPSK